jgi:hypothetical protein
MSHPPLGIDPNRDELARQIHRTPLSDFSVRDLEVWAKCACGSDRYVPTFQVMKILGETAWMDEKNINRLSKALRCSQCSQKGQAAVRVQKRE